MEILKDDNIRCITELLSDKDILSLRTACRRLNDIVTEYAVEIKKRKWKRYLEGIKKDIIESWRKTGNNITRALFVCEIGELVAELDRNNSQDIIAFAYYTKISTKLKKIFGGSGYVFEIETLSWDPNALKTMILKRGMSRTQAISMNRAAIAARLTAFYSVDFFPSE